MKYFTYCLLASVLWMGLNQEIAADASRVGIRGVGATPPNVEYLHPEWVKSEHIALQRHKHKLKHRRKYQYHPHHRHKHPFPKVVASLPLRISIDGKPISYLDKPNNADRDRKTDLLLEKANIQVRFDGLKTDPVLNVTVYPDAAVCGQTVHFMPYSNYLHFIKKAEIRIFEPGQSLQQKPLSVVDAQGWGVDQSIDWRVPTIRKLDAVQYVLRVYDKQGRFDETTPKLLKFVDKNRSVGDEASMQREMLIGYGENHLGLRNIPLLGGSVTVNAEQLGSGSKVWVMGRPVPIDAQGKFADQQLIPVGDSIVTVVTQTPEGVRREFSRPIYIPCSDWFYTGLADLTFGDYHLKGNDTLLRNLDGNEPYRKDVFVDGRLAFYLKGKMQNDWLLTASADTEEQPIDHLFSHFSEKQPFYLLRRLNPILHYPVYGDDSTIIEDAPTKGKFYARLEKNDFDVMWGSFQTKINGTDLFNYSRSLYGANLDYKSLTATKWGERKTQVQGFAADPGSLAAVEEFRATGGSLYYFHQQDIVIGSERLRVEIRDRDSGQVLRVKYLVYGEDYDINYLQGRIVLREALSSTADDSAVIYTGLISGHPVYLVAGYEYTPGLFAIANTTSGGHISHWFGNYINLGLTGYEQRAAQNNQQLYGADATLRYAPGTYIKGEIGQSEGPGTGSLSSPNGGFNFNPLPQTLLSGLTAEAYRVETGLDFSEINPHVQGKFNAYLLKRDDGYSAPGQLTYEALTQSGLTAHFPLSHRWTVNAKGDLKQGKTTGDAVTGELSGDYQWTLADIFTLALRHDDRDTALAGFNSLILSEIGRRNDVAFKLMHSPIDSQRQPKRYKVYGLVQETWDRSLTRSRNNRVALGGHYGLNDRVGLDGEASTGDGGWGGKVGTDYRLSDRASYYANYLMDTERSDIGYRGRNNTITTGVKSRYSDSLSVYGEERYQHFNAGPAGLMHAFGLDLAPNDRWTYGVKLEKGKTTDINAGDFDRSAVSLTGGYKNKKTEYAGKLEWRDEHGSLLGQRSSWLMRNKLAEQINLDSRLLLGLDFAISDAGMGGSFDADYTQAVVAYAYRPVFNDRLNVLLKYTFLDDQANSGQLMHNLLVSPYLQRSHVFAVDGIYDLTPRWGLGGKLAYRLGQLKDNSAVGMPWFNSQAYLGILRLDWHLVKEWDALLEGRYLNAQEAQDAKYGALLGLYRHINDNLKLGLGYNFTDFSDDLTNLSYQNHGVFINLVAKL